jgi:hypothetical protein
VEQHHALAVKLVPDRRYRAVAKCTACGEILAQGPEASAEHLAAYALGLSMGVELRGRVSKVIQAFHRGPACPSDSIRVEIEELSPEGSS